MALQEELQSEFDSLDEMDLTEAQRRRVESIKDLARERGYLKSIDPQATENPRNEQLTSSKSPRIVGLPPGTLETVGEVAGGVGGAIAGAPLGLAGSLAGAGAGVTASRLGIEKLKEFAGKRPPLTMEEIKELAGPAFVEGAVGELGGRLLGAIPGAKNAMMKRFLAGDIKPGEQALYREAQKEGINLSPSVLTESKAPKLIEESLRRTLSAGGKFKAQDLKNEVAFRKAVNNWADQAFGMHPQGHDAVVAHGEMLQKAIKNQVIPEWYGMTKALYKRLDEMTGDMPIVQTDDIYKELTAVKNSLAKRGGSYEGAVASLDDAITRMSKEGPSTGLTVKPKESRGTPDKIIESPVVDKSGEPYKKFVPGVDPKLRGLRVKQKSEAPREPVRLTFSAAQDVRHILGEEIGRMREPLPGADDRAIKKAYALLTEAMDVGALNYSRVTGKDINLQWMLADKMTQRGKQLFNESVIAKVVTDNPEHAVSSIFKKDAYTETKQLMRALDNNPQAQSLYRRGVVEHLINEAVDKSTERVVGSDFANAARKRGVGVLKETFGEHYPAFNKLLEIAERMPKHDSSAGILWYENGLYITGMSAGMTGHLLQKPGVMMAAAAAPAAWFIGTRRLAEIMTTPELTKKLLEVRQMSPTSKAATRIMAQLGAVEIGETGQPIAGTQEPRRGLLTGLTEYLAQ